MRFLINAPPDSMGLKS
jgi:hypothetical protein